MTYNRSSKYYSGYIAKRIISARIDKKLSQLALADIIGLSRASVVNIEKGRQSTTIDKLYKIAYALEKPITYFLPETKGGENIRVVVESKIPVRTLKRLELIPERVLKKMIVMYNSIKRTTK